MNGSAGYSLDQLLEWCKQDRLIDGFRKDDGGILIWQDGTEHSLSHPDAMLYLTRMFTGIHRQTDDPSNTRNSA